MKNAEVHRRKSAEETAALVSEHRIAAVRDSSSTSGSGSGNAGTSVSNLGTSKSSSGRII